MRKKRKAKGKRLARNHTEAEQAQLKTYRERSKKLPPKCRQESNGVVFEAQDELGYATMMEAVGTADVDLTNLLLSQVTRVLPYEEGTMEVKSNGTLAMLHGIAPRDELEGMLAAQMAGVHNLAMEFMRRALYASPTVELASYHVNAATKLTRTFAKQLEALNRHRRKGEQKVTVEHVHVNQGGQAIIGTVNHDNTTGRGPQKK